MKKARQIWDMVDDYAGFALLIAFGFLDVQGYVPVELAVYKEQIYFGLLGLAGIQLRRSQKKDREDIKQNSGTGGHPTNDS